MITRLNAEQAKKRQDDATSRWSRRQGRGRGRESGAETRYYLDGILLLLLGQLLVWGFSSALRIASYPSGGFFPVLF